VAVGNMSPELTGPVQLELAKAVEQLPDEHGMPGGSRYELKWDGFLH
jgi:ATP-dependent DNA ligase